MGELGRLLLVLFPAQGAGVLCMGAGRWTGASLSMGGVRGTAELAGGWGTTGASGS